MKKKYNISVRSAASRKAWQTRKKMRMAREQRTKFPETFVVFVDPPFMPPLHVEDSRLLLPPNPWLEMK